VINVGLFERLQRIQTGEREMLLQFKPTYSVERATERLFNYGAIKPLILLVMLCLAVSWTAVAQSTSNVCAIKGSVFVMDSGGASYVPGAKVTLQGPDTGLQAETDAEGHYKFCDVNAGTYSIEASFPGLQAAQEVTLQATAESTVDLELKPVVVSTSITVADTAADEKVSTITETITEKTIADAPNANERFESLLPMVPGVVRGPDGRINMKGARSTQNGALVNSANVTDPATGSAAINLPIDVVSSVQVISNPYDPQYGKLTGAVSSVDTKTGNYDHSHFSIQNVLPRLRAVDGSVMGIESATPRMTYTGPLIKDKVAFTQSFEYRYVRTPVNSLPALERDQNLEGFNSYTQFDFNISNRQTATVSVAFYPQKLQYLGLNTFTPQPATADYHQRGYQIYGQHRLLTGTESSLVSQFSYKTFDADTTAQNNDPYQLAIETTYGGAFNRQSRRADRFEWQETYNFAPKEFLGAHHIKAGMTYAYATFDGKTTFLPAELLGHTNSVIERVTFTRPSSFNTNQNEASLFVTDEWTPTRRLTVTYGLRSDTDSITATTHVSPRAGIMLALTSDGKTLVKAGGGIFYDRVPLMAPGFDSVPDRTVSLLSPDGQVVSSTQYVNRITGGLQNPRSTAWNVELERQLTSSFSVRVGFEDRNTARNFVINPSTTGNTGIIALANAGSDSYRELQVTGRYTHSRFVVNGSYVHSRAYGNLNDPWIFFGNYPQVVIQPDARGRLSYDAPNRVLLWGDVQGPWKLTITPVWDMHTGFPYSVQNEYREYIGPRNVDRFPWFSSTDLQVTRPFGIHVGERHMKMRGGFAIFNLFNHDNPRDVQTIVNSGNFRDFYNPAWREYRGKLIFEF
jgi:hypothetical protein